ncbi:MAG TPA: hypothetical protein VK821_17925 [Dehalococcoidia bacterium]|nr:hypothetical protein [Dehalococcoidia bacterium]
MTTTAPATSVTMQVYRVYIKATPQAIWDAITRPEWTERYGFWGPRRVRPPTRRQVPRHH